jgi:cysteine-rich repeat protein
MMLGLLSVSGVLAATLASANPLPLSFHLVKVKEVYPGSHASPNAQYVVLQMPAPGENFVAGKEVRVYDYLGVVLGTFTFPGHVPIGTDQATIFVAAPDAQTFFSLPADLTMTAILPAVAGKVCFFDPVGNFDVDCVAWGGYSGTPTGVGAPENAPVGLTRGTVMRRRTDICGAAGNLDICDDTDDSANDFLSGLVPAPRNNMGVNGIIPASICGNSVLQSVEQCDDGNVAPGDGCNATCFREANAFAPQALVVDPAASTTSDGNGVFEPLEEVAVRPSWRNTASAPLALTGAWSSFAAGAGTIPDGTASYGTLPAAATASCTATGDCYALRIAVNPPPRPGVHWDAASAEVNSNYGFKAWTIHIGDSFADVPRSNPFYRFVETLLHRGVTGGCTAVEYCPGASTTRDAMAVFVLVSKEPAGFVPPPCGAAPMFADVPVTSGFCRWVEELARRGVVSGCGPGLYCPSAPATREAMAVFVLRTLDPTLSPPACVAGAEVFPDVPAGNGFCRWIEELFRRGVVTGCGGGNYCPAAPVTREQMGVFLTVTFGLTLYGL